MSEIADGLRQGIKETKNGRPYCLEIVIDRMGPGAESTWYRKLTGDAFEATEA